MADDRLHRILSDWDNVSWITKRRIDWLIIKTKYKIDRKAVASTVTILALIGTILGEKHHLGDTIIVLLSIVLLHFYALLVDSLITSS